MAVAVLATVIVTASLLNLSSEPATGYSALFTNASGLQPGDFVDIAGVQVRHGHRRAAAGRLALVNFTADSDQQLTTTTHADVDYANLLGPAAGQLGAGFDPGATRCRARRSRRRVRRRRST